MLFHENTIIRKIDFSAEQDVPVSQLHIAYGVDRNFFFGCEISISSVLLKNPHIAFSFHIFTDSFSEEEADKIRRLAKEYKTNIIVYLIDNAAFNSLPSNKLWSHAIYYRFLIAEYLADKIDSVLYLDADIICNNALDELIALDFAGNVAAVVNERDESWWRARAEKLGVPGIEKGYFNTGFFYINLIEWKKRKICQEALTLLNDPDVKKKITYFDQDVLNILLPERVLFLPRKYNTQFSLNYELKRNFTNPIVNETIFIHYIGPTKPWHEWGGYASAQPFMDAKQHSPWKHDALMSASSGSQLRYCAKHKLKQGRFFSGYLCYVKYFFRKIRDAVK